MNKSSIVYFCLAVICVLCVPVMAFIYLPVAFVYLLPAAVFFWLGIDTALMVYYFLKAKTGVIYRKAKLIFKNLNRRNNNEVKTILPDIRTINPLPPLPPLPQIASEQPQPTETEFTLPEPALPEPTLPEPTLPEFILAEPAPPEPELSLPLPTEPAPPEPELSLPLPTEPALPEPVPPAALFSIPHYDTDIVKKQLADLDMITTSAIAIMLSDTKAKASSPYIKSMIKTDINEILLKFLNETYYATDIGQLNKLFEKNFYKQKIKKYMREVLIFVKGGISDSLPKKNMWLIPRMRVSRKQTRTYVDKICETINSFESVKYIVALSGNKVVSDSKRNYKLDHLSDNYKDALIYMVDLLLTCTCISKVLFVERMIRLMPEDSEFMRIIENMANSIDNHNLIISKSRPIYKQYYQQELGYISGDDFLYGMAITIMVNKVKKKEHLNPQAGEVIFNSFNYHTFESDMQAWLDDLAKSANTADIGTLILQKITGTIKNNYDMLIDALGELLLWESYYNQRVIYNKRERDKQRYLRGDFENEVLEISKQRK